MDLFSYIVASDSGFAPNPFWGFCTLACCKPAIRRTAEVGDLIVGLTPKAHGHKIVYVMRVSEKMTFAEYWGAKRFQRKKPDYQQGVQHQAGDNIYRLLANGEFIQVRSGHSNPDGTENLRNKRKDLGGGCILVSDDFAYFGAEAIDLPPKYRCLVVGRGHRRLSGQESARTARLIADFNEYFAGLPRGRCSLPRIWSADPSRCEATAPKRRCGGAK